MSETGVPKEAFRVLRDYYRLRAAERVRLEKVE